MSTSGCYDWQARQQAGPAAAELAEAELVAEIRAIHARSRGAYGCPRVVGKLHKQGRRIKHKRIERLMAQHGIKGRCGRRRMRTTIRDPHSRPAADLVKRCFDRDELDALWLGDITYIPTGEGWLYMSSVLDACSRRLWGWSLAEHMRTELVADALEAAVSQRGGRRHIAGVVFHSDHGTQAVRHVVATEPGGVRERRRRQRLRRGRPALRHRSPERWPAMAYGIRCESSA